jgi:opacity protein-like surface antigen
LRAHSAGWRFLAVASLGLVFGAGPAAAQQMQQVEAPTVPSEAAPARLAPGTALEQARLSIRQSGGGDQQGLLNKLKGPAALIDVDAGAGEKLRSIAGATDSPNGGKQRGYVAGTGGAPLLGLDMTLNYAADELGGMAVEGRLSKKIGGVRLGISQTLNHDFESNWTGYGDRRAERITEGAADWSLLSVPVRLAVRETTYADGQRDFDLRTVQTLQLGSGMVVHSTVTGMNDRGPGETAGNLIYYGPIGSVQLTAELDYGLSRGFQPTSALVGLEKSIDDSWSLYAYAQQPLPSGTGRVDFGAAREVGGFMAGAFGGAAADGSAYVGLRIWVPLSPGSRDHRWLGF